MPTPALSVVVQPETAPVVVGQVFEVRTDKIRVGTRLRELDQSWAIALNGIMVSEGGQKDPIDLFPIPGTDEFELGAGLHRLAARQIGGHDTVRAFILEGDAFDRRTREVSENLWKLSLTPLDRAANIAALYELQLKRAGLEQPASPQSVASKARWEKALKGDADDASAKMAHAYGFTDEVAAQVGLSRRAVYRDLHLHKAIAPGLKERLRGSDILKNAAQLQALAKLDQAEQRKVVEVLVEGRAKGVSEAVSALSGAAKPSAESKRLSTVMATMQRMGRAERKAALELLIETFGAGVADV